MIDDYGGAAAVLERAPYAGSQLGSEKPANPCRSDEGEKADPVTCDEKFSVNIVADTYLAPTLWQTSLVDEFGETNAV